MTRARHVLTATFALSLAAATPAMAVSAGVQRAGAPVIAVAGASIAAPETVDAGTRVQVEIQGGARGTLELWGPISQDGDGERLLTREVAGGSAEIDMNFVAGSYRLRYLDEAGTLAASAVIDISAAAVELLVPEIGGPSDPLTVHWRGPAGAGDKLQLVDRASNSVVSEVDALATAGDRMATDIPGPGAPGDYELRYVTAGGTVLQRLALSVAPSLDWLRSPVGVATRQSFDVEWNGRARPGHVFRIVSRDGATTLATADPAGPEAGPLRASLRAPARRGGYLVQYADPATDTVASSQPLDVD